MSVRTNEGFTLTEVLVAMSIAAVALMALATMFPTAATNVDYNAAITRATALGQQRIEQMKNLPFATLVGMDTSGNPTPPPDPPASATQNITEGNNAFTRRTWIRVSGTAPRREAVITVILDWTEPTGSKTLRLDGLVAERT